ncbi:hypothetical protein Droror1_Dr00010263 [Drosera rotundifolia]
MKILSWLYLGACEVFDEMPVRDELGDAVTKFESNYRRPGAALVYDQLEDLFDFKRIYGGQYLPSPWESYHLDNHLYLRMDDLDRESQVPKLELRNASECSCIVRCGTLRTGSRLSICRYKKLLFTVDLTKDFYYFY